MKQFLLCLALFGSLYSCVFDDGFTPLQRRHISQSDHRNRKVNMYENFKPLGKYLLVRLNKQEEKTSGGLFIAQMAKIEERRIATVLAIGDEVTKVNVGDVVFMGRVLVRATDEICILVEDDVFGIIE